MTKLIIALSAVAAVAALAWLRHRRKRDEELTAYAPQETTPAEAVEENPVELPSEVVVPETHVERAEQPQPVSVGEVASDVLPTPPTELAPVSADLGDTGSEPHAEIPANIASPPPNSEAFIDEADQTPPPLVVTPKSGTQQEIPTRSHVTKAAKPIRERTRPPESGGGGQMESEENDQPTQPRKRTRSGPQLRLVCFKDTDRMWKVAVELPEDFSSRCEINVVHEGQRLEPVRFGENRWPLHRLNGNIEAAEAGSGGQRWQLETGGDECLLFKLLAEGETEEGRLVSASSRGQYLVISPEAWPMPDSSGIQVFRERNVGIDGYVGYRFTVGDCVQPRLEFRPRDGQRARIQFRTTCFTLEGERANAVSGEYQAPLFLKSAPRVCAPDSESWLGVEKVVIGVAGKGRNKWTKGFKPNPTNNEIQLSEHLNGKKGGWYFVRLYDADEVLIDDGIYFAFVKTLRSIKVSGTSALPTISGHAEARLEFEHDTGASVKIFGEHESQPFDSGTAFIVPSCCEQVDWEISWPGEPPLKCATRIERIWWALGSANAPPADADWTDKPVAGKRADWFASSDKVLFVRLPSANSMDRFWAGFARDVARLYIAAAEERNVSVALRDFSASNQVHTVGVTPFSVWVWQNGREVFAEALRLEIVYECSFCQKQFRTDGEALAHTVEHEKEFIRELTYDELRCLDPDLPPAIYQCLHPNCGWYVHAYPVGYPTDAIIHHITDRHGNPHGPTPISYRIVTDLDEIRRNVERHLPQIFRCKCGEKFENVRPEDFAEHIFRRHRSQLYNLV